MPTYSYRCTTCKHEWDEQRSVDLRDSDLFCPNCNNGYVTRAMIAPPVHFKGTGFYKTGG